MVANLGHGEDIEDRPRRRYGRDRLFRGCLWCSEPGGDRSANDMASPKTLRQQAERLFALALQARERGDVPLAEQLTERAMQYLEEANGHEDSHEPSPPGHPPPSVPQQQQQQAQQLTDDTEGEDE